MMSNFKNKNANIRAFAALSRKKFKLFIFIYFISSEGSQKFSPILISPTCE